MSSKDRDSSEPVTISVVDLLKALGQDHKQVADEWYADGEIAETSADELNDPVLDHPLEDAVKELEHLAGVDRDILREASYRMNQEYGLRPWRRHRNYSYTDLMYLYEKLEKYDESPKFAKILQKLCNNYPEDMRRVLGAPAVLEIEGVSDDPRTQRTSRTPINKGGRPPLDDAEKRRRHQLHDEWQQAKGAGVKMKDFCGDRGYNYADVQKCLNWVSRRGRPRSS